MVKSIALDAMGGDQGPKITIPAALDVIRKYPDVRIILVGDKSILSQELHRLGTQESQQLRIQHASQTISMDEPPAQALRTKKDASMRVAIDLIKQERAQACVSAGNTGALMAISRFVLKTIQGIDRPAIITLLPTITDRCYMLDLGANVNCSVDQLFQFAVMGSVLAKTVKGIDRPTVALLNVGEEDIKGNEQVKAAAKKLSESQVINYIGFVEGNAVYQGAADVIVCDGFIGNIALKTSEGVAKLLQTRVREAFNDSLWGKLSAMTARPILKRLRKDLDTRTLNGATFIGLKGIVIKSHGNADKLAFACAIKEAIKEIDQDVPTQIHQQIEALMQEMVSV